MQFIELEKLIESTLSRLQNILIVTQFVTSPFVEIYAEELSTYVMRHFEVGNTAVEMELIDFQTDLS